MYMDMDFLTQFVIIEIHCLRIASFFRMLEVDITWEIYYLSNITVFVNVIG